MLYFVSRKKWHFFQEYFNTSTLKGQTTFFFDTYIFLGHACIYNDLNHIKCYTYTRTCQENAMEAIFNQLSNNMICQPKMVLYSKFVFCSIGPESSLQNLITLEVLCNLVKNRFLNQYWEVLWNAMVNILAKNPYPPRF